MTDPRTPRAEDCVLAPLIDRHARERGEAVFAVFDDGSAWTYGALADRVRETAAGLAALGVGKGAHVAVWLPNGPDALRVWFAINYLGAVCAPLNLGYRGAILAHAIRLSRVKLIVCHAGLADRLVEIDLAEIEAAVVLSGPPPATLPVPCLGPEALRGDPLSLDGLDRAVAPWDLQCLMFTSGTTGPSKAVRSTYLHLYSVCDYPYRMFRPDDRYLVNLPMFHVGGTVAVYAMLMRGASIAVVESFRASEFWDVVRRSGATIATLLGSMTPLLWAAPETPQDANTPLRLGMMIPLVQDAKAFGKRFGCEIRTLYNMTEISSPIISDAFPEPLGVCGRPRPGVEARVVDENDIELPAGAVGELILRVDVPWAFTEGYFDNAEASARLWRNGWLHTGDAFRVSAKGDFFFVDRLKDAIRRRGENISSFEVEADVAAHPNIKECAVVGVRDAIGEEEVLAVVVLRDSNVYDPAEMLEFFVRRMPHFMVPRYIRRVDAMPLTPTLKIQKHVLRDEGVTADTWDREAAGLSVRRTRLTN
jgi:crotonobetaine/carnitine-CoA ligase